MSTRLTDILERLRPTGTPGPSGERSQDRTERDRATELAEVIIQLTAIENEANAVVEQARRLAEQIHDNAAETVRRLSDELPDRLATAAARAAGESAERTTVERQRINAQATSAIEQIQQHAPAKISEIVHAAVALLLAGDALESRSAPSP